MDENINHVAASTLFFDDKRNCLLLDGHELSRGENIEIRVFGSWIPGEVVIDSAGWYLVTLDQVDIRLHNGLHARSSKFHISEATPVPTGQTTVPPRILIVDDDPALLQALPRTIALRLPEVEVDTAHSARDALQLIQERRYDTIVSDIKMPEMDGLALLGKSQELQPDVPTLLITGHGEHNIAIQALRGGAYDYIQKPIERDNFIAALLRSIQTCQLRRQVQEQQRALELYSRSLERLVQQRTDELIEAHATKDKVLSLVSHEMKGPIARLKDIMRILHQKMENTSLPEIVAHSFMEIEDSITRTEELTQELLNTSRIETQKFILRRQRCDLIALCHDVLIEATSNSDTHLEVQKLAGPVEVEIDEMQIRQVLSMLVSGTPLSTHRESPTAINIQQIGNEVILTMRDEGVRPSLGSGFYVSRKIVERHGGRLELQSFPYNRRTLFITLPALSSQSDGNSVSSLPHTHATWIITYSDERATSEMV